MPYFPQDPPVAADLESYFFKEWLQTVQQFYYNEAGFLSLDDVPSAGVYYLKLSDTYIYFDTTDPGGTILYFPKAQEVIGKKYYLFISPDYAPVTFDIEVRVTKDYGTVSGDGWVTIAPTSFNVKYEFIATEEGWVVNTL